MVWRGIAWYMECLAMYGIVYDMAWQAWDAFWAWHGIWKGLAGIACGHGMLYGMVEQAYHGTMYMV